MYTPLSLWRFLRLPGVVWLCLFSCHMCLLSAQIPDAKNREVDVLLDSLDHYRIVDPLKAIAVGEEILCRTQEHGNERLHFQTAMACANAEKMLSRVPEALEYCNQAIRLAADLDTADLIFALFTKATVFNVNEIVDSTIIYYQRVISLTPKGKSTFYRCNAYTGIGTVYWLIGNPTKAEEYLLDGMACGRGLSGNSRAFSVAPLIQFYIQNNDSRYLQYLDTLVSTDFFSHSSPEAKAGHFDAFLLMEDLPDDEREQRLSEVYAYYVNNNRPLDGQYFFAKLLTDHLRSVGHYVRVDSILQKLLEQSRQQQRIVIEARVLKAIYDNYREMKDDAGAFFYIEQLLSLNDRILEDQNRNLVHELNIRFEAAEKDHRISEQQLLLAQEERNRRYMIAFTLLGAMLAVIVFLYLRHRVLVAKRIAEQDRLLHTETIARMHQEQQLARVASSLEARERERKRISRDLHDEVGSALSSIHIYSSAAERAIDSAPDTTRTILQQISENSRQVMDNMSDIVWAINTAGNGEMTLEKKIKNYGYELLTPGGISCTYEIAPEAEKVLVHMEVRKNILLIIKEAINNVAKYSHASHATVSLMMKGDTLQLQISDNGRGFSPELTGRGNGLVNMQKRTEEIGGTFTLTTSTGRGTQISCDFPIPSFSDMRSGDPN